MDPAVLEAVIGRRPAPAASQPASLEGYSRVYRRGAWYPILVEASGEQVHGVLNDGLRGGDAARLTAFEGDDYRLVEMPVRASHSGHVVARVFMAVPGVLATAKAWLPDDWRRRHRRAYVERVIRTHRPR